jgi:hypothetical protein
MTTTQSNSEVKTKSEIMADIEQAFARLSPEDLLDAIDIALTEEDKKELIARWTAREDLPGDEHGVPA